MSLLRGQTRGGLGRVCATGMYRSIEHVKFPKFQTGIFVEWQAAIHQPTAWPVPHAYTQPHHLGNGSHGQLFCPYWVNEPGKTPCIKDPLLPRRGIEVHGVIHGCHGYVERYMVRCRGAWCWMVMYGVGSGLGLGLYGVVWWCLVLYSQNNLY